MPKYSLTWASSIAVDYAVMTVQFAAKGRCCKTSATGLVHAFIAEPLNTESIQKERFFTYAVKTEGSVYAIWEAIPGISDKFGEARVHCLPIFIKSVHIVKVHLYNPLMSGSQHTHHSYFSMVIKKIILNTVNSHLVQGCCGLQWRLGHTEH